jgi:hypothetical protein
MAIQQDLNIMQLEDAVNALPHEEHARFGRIFEVSSTTGGLVARCDGAVDREAVRQRRGHASEDHQVTNVVTRGVLFNWLHPAARSGGRRWTSTRSWNTNHARWLTVQRTPEDLFGRVRGKFCVTASNIAKFDGFHGLVVFNEKHPLRFTREMLHDYVDTGGRWGDSTPRPGGQSTCSSELPWRRAAAHAPGSGARDALRRREACAARSRV